MEPSIREIDVDAAHERLQDGDAMFIDVRDDMSFRTAAIPGAQQVTDLSLEDFLEDTPRDQALIVYCYHGNMSRGGAAYFQSQGFAEVYSMAGGFELWRSRHEHQPGRT